MCAPDEELLQARISDYLDENNTYNGKDYTYINNPYAKVYHEEVGLDSSDVIDIKAADTETYSKAPLAYTFLTFKQYNALLIGIILYGLVANYVLINLFSKPWLGQHSISGLLFYAIIAVIGGLIPHWSDNPWISFLGYNIMVLPFGTFLYHLINDGLELDGTIVTNIFLYAVFITAGIFAFSLIIKEDHDPVIFIVSGFITGLVAGILIPLFWMSNLDLLAIVIAIVFCTYLAVDFYYAQNEDHLIDSAVDRASTIYVHLIYELLWLMVRAGLRTSSDSDRDHHSSGRSRGRGNGRGLGSTGHHSSGRRMNGGGHHR